MKFNMHSAKLKLTPAIKDYIENKINKLDKYIENCDECVANILVKTKNEQQTIEVTIPVKKFILRAEETHTDLYAAIDLVSDKLERQIRKNKTRMKKKLDKSYNDFNLNFKIEKTEEEKGNVVKRKIIETKPMSEDEAVLQMNLIGHDFFVYKNMENQVAVIYKRNDNNYGIIEVN